MKSHTHEEIEKQIRVLDLKLSPFKLLPFNAIQNMADAMIKNYQLHYILSTLNDPKIIHDNMVVRMMNELIAPPYVVPAHLKSYLVNAMNKQPSLLDIVKKYRNLSPDDSQLKLVTEEIQRSLTNYANCQSDNSKEQQVMLAKMLQEEGYMPDQIMMKSVQ